MTGADGMTATERVLAFIALWNARDLDGILDALTDDCFYHNMPWAPLIGRAAIAETLGPFVASAEAIDWIVHHAAEAADGTVLTERTDRFLVKGRWVEIAVMGVFKFDGPRIASWRDYFDAARFQAAMAGPAAG